MKKADTLKNLEMAKKRDHKIMITDEAIKKVPRIEYREIESAQYDILWELAKEVLLVSKEKFRFRTSVSCLCTVV
jgi:hypothetical protein